MLLALSAGAFGREGNKSNTHTCRKLTYLLSCTWTPRWPMSRASVLNYERRPQLLTMGAGNGTDFLNSDFPIWAAGGVGVFAVYRAYVVSV